MPQALKVKRRHGDVASVSVSAPHMAPRIRLEPNLAKIIGAITWIVAEADRRKREITQYDVLKTLFLADKSHLNEYGRPVTFDNYYAMKDGPVASVAYNLLKEDKRTLGKYRGMEMNNIPDRNRHYCLDRNCTVPAASKSGESNSIP